MIEALRGVVGEVILAFAPLVEASGDPERLLWLLSELGWTPDSVPQPLVDLAVAGSDLLSLVDTDLDEGSASEAFDAVGKLVDAIDQIRTKPDSAFPSGVDVASFRATIGADLFDYLLVEHLLRNHYSIGGPLLLAGFIRLVEQPAAGLRQPYLRRQIMWSAAGEIFKDPANGFREAFDWNSAAPRLTKALGALGSLLEQVGLQFSYIRPLDDLLTFVTAGATDSAYDYLGIDVVFDTRALGTTDFVAGVKLLVLPAIPSRGLAMGLLPYATLAEAMDVDVADNLTLSVQGDADFTKGIALILAPGQPLDLQAGFLGGQATSPATIQLGLTYTPPSDEPERILIGVADGSRLSIRGVTLFAGATLIAADRIDAFVELRFQNAVVAIKPAPGEADSFIGSLLGDQGISAQLSFGLSLSSLTGFHLTGSDGLSANLPVDVHVGPVDVQAIELGLDSTGGDVSLTVGAAVAGTIGPVSILADRLGFTLRARFPKPPTGNLGPVDLNARFAPPSGVGLSVDAQGVVTGGGFLRHDPVQELYAGVMQLSLHEQLTVQAFGLISTRMPDGGPGYSLLVFITAEDFQPIPLGLGFTLQGIGGMVGINRTFDEAVLRAAMQNDTLRSLLFPRDPVANAPAIISALASGFPARSGSYLMGILVRIGWGTPTLIWLDLALILEFGTRLRLLALGRISALLPSPDNDLVRLNLDAVGVLDLDQGSLAIDAVLVDSRLVHKFVLTGAGALRAGGSGAFVLAVGGFNPRFAPPAGVPSLPRVAIALSSGNNPRLICDAYFALTANTVQFGARAQLHAEAYGFSVDGDVGFDVLISRAPLHFIADFHSSVQLKHGSHSLFKVSLEGSLEGPRPLRASGKASFEIFWCHFTVRFDRTLVEGDPPPLPAAIDVQGQLLQALSAAQSWRTDVVANRTHGVALRKLAPGTALVIDPLGRLVVTQDVVPLNTGRDIDIFGGAPVAGARRFVLGVSLNGVTLTPPQPLPAAFAPAQFFDMSDDEKLASPSFEEMDAGMAVGSDAVTFDPKQLVAAPLEYESIVIDTLAPPGNPPPPLLVLYPLAVSQLQGHSATGAAARAPVRRVGRARFRTAGPAAVQLPEPRWAIVAIDAAPEVAVAPTVRTWSEHLAALHVLNRGGARYQLVPAPQPS